MLRNPAVLGRGESKRWKSSVNATSTGYLFYFFLLFPMLPLVLQNLLPAKIQIYCSHVECVSTVSSYFLAFWLTHSKEDKMCCCVECSRLPKQNGHRHANLACCPGARRSSSSEEEC